MKTRLLYRNPETDASVTYYCNKKPDSKEPGFYHYSNNILILNTGFSFSPQM